mgnify:CR=1 FL=1|jgi:hypothetical protein
MATSVVDICNNALIRIGSKTITSLSDGDKVANACSAIYEQTRDMLLRQHLWNFSIKRVVLASEEDAPGFGYNYSYPLPSDFIRAKEVYGSEMPYKIEQTALITDDNEVNLVYISRVEDVTKFDPLFVEALILSIALRLSYILIGSNGREQALKDELKQILFLAKQVDGQDDTPDQLTSDRFLQAKWTSAWDPTKVYSEF